MVKSALEQYFQKQNPEQSETWIEALQLVSDKSCLKVLFPHPFFGAWFFTHKRTLFEQAVKTCFPNTYAEIVYDGLSAQRQNPTPLLTKKKKSSASFEEISETLENFVFNQKNAFPLAALAKIVRNQPGSLYSPVLLCGKSGTGKTHLLNGMAHAMFPSDTLPFVLCKALDVNRHLGFGNEIDFWKKCDALFIDDIQEIKDNKVIQQTLINYLDHCPPNRQIVITCSDRPNALTYLSQRLQARLLSSLVLDIAEPDIDVRLRFIQKICRNKRISLNNQQMLCVAQHTLDCRQIIGILLKIHAFITIHERNLEKKELYSILKTEKIEKIDKNISYYDIIQKVALSMNVQLEEMMGKKRQNDLVRARQCAMYLCRERLGLSYPEIGRVFGGKDHSTVMHAIKKIEQLRVTDRETNMLLTQLTNDF